MIGKLVKIEKGTLISKHRSSMFGWYVQESFIGIIIGQQHIIRNSDNHMISMFTILSHACSIYDFTASTETMLNLCLEQR